MLTDIRALADHFLIVLPNINMQQWVTPIWQVVGCGRLGRLVEVTH